MSITEYTPHLRLRGNRKELRVPSFPRWSAMLTGEEGGGEERRSLPRKLPRGAFSPDPVFLRKARAGPQVVAQ